MSLPGEDRVFTELECACGLRFPHATNFGRIDPAADHRRESGHGEMTEVPAEVAA